MATPWRLSWNSMSIRRDQRIGPIKEPWCARNLPKQNGPPGPAADGEGQGDRAGTADLDATFRNGPRCSVTLSLGHPGDVVLARCL